MLGEKERWSLEVAGAGGHDLITIMPVLERRGVAVSPVGLPLMLNCGGAVLSCQLGEGGCVCSFWKEG